MSVVLTNFMIAVVVTTYERVQERQEAISVRHKAELNYECYMLKGFFIKLKEYKIVVMSTISVI